MRRNLLLYGGYWPCAPNSSSLLQVDIVAAGTQRWQDANLLRGTLKLNVTKPRLKLPSPRGSLIAIHRDLLKIHQCWIGPFDDSTMNLSAIEKMVVVLEDRRFFRHSGIDLKSGAREIARAVTFRRHGGASTIDMQFVRTATGYRQRTIGRKTYECLLSWLIQFRYSKLSILRSYLDVAFFGSGLIGVEAAANKMFGKSAWQLDIDEAATIAAMLVYPRPLKPEEAWLKRVARRAAYGKRIYVTMKEKLDQLG